MRMDRRAEEGEMCRRAVFAAAQAREESAAAGAPRCSPLNKGRHPHWGSIMRPAKPSATVAMAATVSRGDARPVATQATTCRARTLMTKV